MFLYSYCVRNVIEGKQYRTHKLFKSVEDVTAELINVIYEFLVDHDLQYKHTDIKNVDDEDYETIFHETDDYQFIILKWDSPI